MTLTTGDHIPSLEAAQDNGRPYVPIPGRWRVLFFFPKTVTSHCQLQARQYQALLADFQALNVDVIGINSDPRQEQLAFRSVCQLDYPLLNDGQQRISTQFGLLDEPWPGEQVRRPRRETFLVDPSGTVRRHWTQVDAGQDALNVLEGARELLGGESRQSLG